MGTCRGALIERFGRTGYASCMSENPASQPVATARSVPQAQIDTPEHMRIWLQDARQTVELYFQGHRDVVQLILATVLAHGHVLLEDVPGVGKTTLARIMAHVLGLELSRIQFTADMLPADVTGMQILNPATGQLSFRPGPLFAEMVLADEINRASPKTQSAMLEGMEEKHVTIDDERHALPEVFCVLATQNPMEHHGVYPLPESQLDRFMIRTSLGYPTVENERHILLSATQPSTQLEQIVPVLNRQRIVALQQACAEIHMHEEIADYLLALVHATRNRPEIALGCSPRGSIALARLARAWAFLQGRDFVKAEDIKHVFVPVIGHRIVLANAASNVKNRQAILSDILETLPVPR